MKGGGAMADEREMGIARKEEEMKAKSGKGAVDGSDDEDDGRNEEEVEEEIEDPKEEEDDDEVNPRSGAQVQSVSDEDDFDDDDDDEGDEDDEDDVREGNRRTYRRPRYISPSPLLARFDEYFEKYPWYSCSTIFAFIDEGCGFMMRDSPGAVSIIEATHIINGKEASIRRILYILKIPKNATAEELMHTFLEFGKVVEYDFDSALRTTERGWRFGLVMFDSEKVVDELVAKGTIEFCGEHLEVKKVELLVYRPNDPTGMFRTAWTDQPNGNDLRLKGDHIRNIPKC